MGGRKAGSQAVKQPEKNLFQKHPKKNLKKKTLLFPLICNALSFL